MRRFAYFIIVILCPLLFAPTASADQPAAGELTLAAVGDLMLGNRTEPFLKEFGPAYPFADVMPFLSRADLVVGNLESAISERGTAVENKKFTLRAGPVAVEALKSAGIKVVTLANNHSMDFGPLALQDTLSILGENSILATGAGMDLDDARAPAIVKIKGRTVAFLSYSLTFPLEFYASARRPGTAPGYADFVRTDIEKVRPAADLVVVSFHWGAELMTAAKDYQIELGRRAIDWGADLVLGHHPHVLQELEVYRGRLIAYSLGNFVFGSESNRTNTSMILLLTFQGNCLSRVEAVPLDVNNYRVKYRPKVLTGKAAAEVLDSVNAGSARFKTRLEIAGDRGTLELAPPTAAASQQTATASVTAAAPGNSPRTSSATAAP
jgi:poly-gamma-glutamate synthesis protein (capsule biosynthesis protein)